MQPLLYRDLVPWYRLVDPPADHLDEAACYQAAFESAASPRSTIAHLEGLFSRETWRRILGEAGFRVELIERPIGEGQSDEIFLCRRP